MNEKRQLIYGSDIRVAFGARDVLAIDKLEIFEGDRIGLIGANGAGKTTLLRLLAGMEDGHDNGHAVVRRCQAAYVKQAALTDAPDDARDDDAQDSELSGRFGVVDSPKPSGGEQTRRALAQALSRRTPLLLLDEPTTNLDMDGVAELQRRLQAHKGALVLVSHDRALLDAVCGQIWEIENAALRVFPGDYSAYRQQKQRERDFAQAEYEAYRDEERRLTQRAREVEARAAGMLKPRRNMASSEWLLYKDVMGGQQKHVHGFVKSLRSRIDHLEVKQRPENLPDIAMSLGAGSPIASKTALRFGPADIAFGERTLLRDASFTLPTRTRTVMIGSNGAGKTTLVRRILDGAEGVALHADALIGYFSQAHEVLDADKTALDNARSQSQQPESAARTVLARLGMRGDDVFKPARVLSGGERAKTALARLLLADVNLLILDEPTNHLDLFAMEALEALLAAYEGTMLVITHDRALSAAVAQRVIRVDGGSVTTHEGDWASYQRSLEPTPPDAAREQVNEDILRMRMAALTGRIAACRKPEEKKKLEKEWQQLLREMRGE